MRSLLFVPADSERKLAKSLESTADALILDLEDSIGPDRKAVAREMAAAFLQTPEVRDCGKPIWVRINPLDTPLWHDDVVAVMTAGPFGIMQPKAVSGEDVDKLGLALGEMEAANGLTRGTTQILPIATEVPRALLQMPTFLDITQRMSALTWGAEDLSAELGSQAARDETGKLASPFRLARDLCLITAVAAGAQPLDTVYVNFRDDAGLAAECQAAARDGFTGKLAIHPGQVDTINAAFTPPPEHVAWAEKVVAVFADTGTGVASMDGEMLDRPHLKRAERILARVRGRS